MWRGHLCACVNFFPPIESVSSLQSVDDCLCKCYERSSDCQLLQNDGTTRTAVLHQILPKAWRYPSGNYSKDSTGLRGRCHEYHTNKEWYNRLKDGSTSVNSEPRHGRPSVAEMIISSTKCGLRSCRTVVSLSENWQAR